MKVITQQPVEFQSGANGLVNYVATEGNQNISANLDEFSSEDDFLSNASGEEDFNSEFSYAIGDTIKTSIANRRKRKNEKAASKNKARELKAEAKLEKAKSVAKQADSLARAAEAQSKSDTALVQNSTIVPTEEKKGMSTGVKVAIGVGIALAVTGIVVLIVKMKKK